MPPGRTERGAKMIHRRRTRLLFSPNPSRGRRPNLYLRPPQSGKGAGAPSQRSVRRAFGWTKPPVRHYPPWNREKNSLCGHEATVSKIGEDQMFYLIAGLKEQEPVHDRERVY